MPSHNYRGRARPTSVVMGARFSSQRCSVAVRIHLHRRHPRRSPAPRETLRQTPESRKRKKPLRCMPTLNRRMLT